MIAKFPPSRFLATGSLAAAVLAIMSPMAGATPRSFSLPAFQANPGGVLEVPLSLDNAAGLAAIQVNINFDPDVLDLLAVTSGPLGDAFELSSGESEGVVQLVLARADALAGGSGRVASLKFRANPGAEVDLYSELAIADLVLSDETGVIDLRQKDDLVTANGQVVVSVDANIDNSGNGLPDWWEESFGLDMFADHADNDEEGDGLTTLEEYAYGGNPLVSDADIRSPRIEFLESAGETFLRLGFFRRPNDPFIVYLPQESANLEQWSVLDVASQIHGMPEDMGDGTEYVRILSTSALSGVDAAAKGFVRVEIEAAE